MHEVVSDFDLLLVENAFWVVTNSIHNPVYDFRFDSYFACNRPWNRPKPVLAIARLGALPDYGLLFDYFFDQGIQLVNSPHQHSRASELPEWYPLLVDLTPKSAWYDSPPLPAVVSESFGWPVFVKGARQTSHHDPSKSIAHNPSDYERLVQAFQRDPILHWQRFVIRKYVDLRPLECNVTTKIKPSFEFRTFWWNQKLVGVGPYWSQFVDYTWTASEKADCLAIAENACSRLDCPFLVIDMAQTIDGEWIVIECNDAQESGYAGVSPFSLWHEIIQVSSAGNHRS